MCNGEEEKAEIREKEMRAEMGTGMSVEISSAEIAGVETT